MGRLIAGADRTQTTLFPPCMDDWIDEENPVRVVDVFVDALDLSELGFESVAPASTGRPSYHPSVLLKAGIHCAVVDRTLDNAAHARITQTTLSFFTLAERSCRQTMARFRHRTVP